MQSKLMLTVDQKVIEQAKKYAKANSRSLSNIVEEYLKSLSLIKENRKAKKYSKIIHELKGSVKFDKDNIDYKVLLEDALLNKHLK